MQQFTLPSNGLRVVLYPLPGAMNCVAHCSYLDVGSALEQKGSYGFAHLLEHMVFKGTRATAELDPVRMAEALGPDVARQLGPRPPHSHVRDVVHATFAPEDVFPKLVACGVGLSLHECDIDTIARVAGARLNAFTSTDNTSYHFTTLGPERMVPFLCIMSDCMERLNVTDDHIASEVRAVLAEMKRGNDNTVRTALQHCSPLLFELGSAGHHSTIGDEMMLAQASAATLIDFHKEHYQPWNCTLSLTGNVGDMDVMRARIEEIFGRVGVANYAAHKAIAAVPVGTEVPPATLQLVAQLDNAPLQRAFGRRVDELQRAHACGCTQSFDAMTKPAALPSATHRTVYDHAAVPVNVFGFHVPGYGDGDNTSAQHVWNAVTELLTGTAAARLPSSFQSYVDRHADGGALYLITETAHEDMPRTIEAALRRPVSEAEHGRVQNALHAHWAGVQEDPATFANHLVHCLTQRTLPSEPAFTRPQLQAALDTLRTDRMQHVTVRGPGDNTAVAQALEQRNAVRVQNAATLTKLKARVAPLESTYALQYAPPVTPLQPASLRFPPCSVQAGGDVKFVHPSTRMCHYSIASARDPQHDLSQYAATLAAKTLHFGTDGAHTLERAGVAFSMDGTGASLAVACSPTDAAQHVHALLQRVKADVHEASFDDQRRQFVSALQQESQDPVKSCMHAAANLVFRPERPFSYTDAIAYVNKLTPTAAQGQLQANLAGAVHLFVGPR